MAKQEHYRQIWDWSYWKQQWPMGLAYPRTPYDIIEGHVYDDGKIKNPLIFKITKLIK